MIKSLNRSTHQTPTELASRPDLPACRVPFPQLPSGQRPTIFSVFIHSCHLSGLREGPTMRGKETIEGKHLLEAFLSSLPH